MAALLMLGSLLNTELVRPPGFRTLFLSSYIVENA